MITIQDQIKQIVKDTVDERMHSQVNWNRYKPDLVDITVDIVELAEMIESHVNEAWAGQQEMKRGEI